MLYRFQKDYLSTKVKLRYHLLLNNGTLFASLTWGEECVWNVSNPSYPEGLPYRATFSTCV